MFSRQAQRSFKEDAEVKLAYFYTCAIEAYVIIPVIVSDRFGFHSGIEGRKEIFLVMSDYEDIFVAVIEYIICVIYVKLLTD